MRSLIVLALLLASATLLAQESTSDNAPTKVRPCVGKNPPQPCVIQPVAITQPAPDYSDEGREKKVEGEVYLDFVVGVDGRTHDVQVAKSLGYGLDEKSIEAVKQWTFKPGTIDGNPVPVKLKGSVSFHLLKK
jgi:TonB family protein